MYASKAIHQISTLVKLQPSPTFFFKVFLELGLKSILQFISFDRASIEMLFDEKNHKFFEEELNAKEFPVFYKNEDSNSIIDVALEANSIKSLNLMVGYIIKYQNSYVYADLFYHNLLEQIDKGVEVKRLFKSKIFYY